MRSEPRRSLTRLFRLLALSTVLVTLLSEFSGLALVFELLCHFRVQYLIVALLLLVVFAHFRCWGWWSLSLLAAVINAVAVLPWYWGKDPQATAQSTTRQTITRQSATRQSTIALVQSNLHSANTDMSRLLALIDVEQPSLLLVQELTHRAKAQLQSLSVRLPHQFTVPRNDNFGIGLYSHWPIVNSEVLYLGDAKLPAIRADINVNGAVVAVIAFHPPPPIGRELYRERNRQQRQLARYVAGLDGPVIVAGDFNSSMWSDHYRALEAISGLRNSRKGFGVLPSWPAHFFPLGIPLDHCLVSSDIVVVESKLGAGIGSDHRPLVVRLRVESEPRDRSNEHDNKILK